MEKLPLFHQSNELLNEIRNSKPKLISLEDHNSGGLPRYQPLDSNPRLNGIACPKCGTELFDSKPMEILTSNPPQKNVHCVECDYKGYRRA